MREKKRARKTEKERERNEEEVGVENEEGREGERVVEERGVGRERGRESTFLSFLIVHLIKYIRCQIRQHSKVRSKLLNKNFNHIIHCGTILYTNTFCSNFLPISALILKIELHHSFKLEFLRRRRQRKGMTSNYGKTLPTYAFLHRFSG